MEYSVSPSDDLFGFWKSQVKDQGYSRPLS